MTTEERDYVQEIVDDSFELFISDVMEQRNISRADIEEAQIVRGARAIELGLVDRTGNLYAAMEGARELSRSRKQL
jgi:protease-4